MTCFGPELSVMMSPDINGGWGETRYIGQTAIFKGTAFYDCSQ